VQHFLPEPQQVLPQQAPLQQTPLQQVCPDPQQTTIAAATVRLQQK